MGPYADLLSQSQNRDLAQTDQERGIPQPPLELPIPEGTELIALPEPGSLCRPAMTVREAAEQRRSIRRYSLTDSLTLVELAYLLWLTQGVKEITARPSTLRTVPSAGARHAFETYLLINRVAGLPPGLYRYCASRHALLALDAPETIGAAISRGCWDQAQVERSAVTFLWVAVSERMNWRYANRGFRYLFLDAGHVCQNLYLAAETIQCGACAIGGFRDDLLNQALTLDGESQFVIYLATVGKKLASQA